MSDLAQILCVLGALTVLLATLWVRPGGVLFVSHCGEHLRLRWLAGHALLANYQGGALWGNLTPLGASFVASPWPLVVSPQGVLAGALTAPTPDGRTEGPGDYMAFTELKSVRADERWLLLNERPFLAAQSKSVAARWARWLGELLRMPEADRGRWIERQLAASCHAEEARAAWRQCQQNTWWVRRTSTLAFAYCFLALGSFAFAEVSVPFVWLLPGYFVLVAMVFLAYLRAERRTHPQGKNSWHGWLILVSPVDAFRAADHLVRPPLEHFHPLALGRAVLSPAKANEFARAVARDVRYPLPWLNMPASAPADATVQWFSERMQRALSPLIALPENEILAPPLRDADALAYCPRCEAQFTHAQGGCTLCGISLVEFGRDAERKA